MKTGLILAMCICLVAGGLGYTIGSWVFPHTASDAFWSPYSKGYDDGRAQGYKQGVIDGKYLALHPEVVDFSIYPTELDVSVFGVNTTVSLEVLVHNKSINAHNFRLTVEKPTFIPENARYKAGEVSWTPVCYYPGTTIDLSSVCLGGGHEAALKTNLRLDEEVPNGYYMLWLRVRCTDQPDNAISVEYICKVLISFWR